MMRVAAVALLLTLSGALSAARADTINYQIALGNPAVSSYTGPYADVLVDRTSTTTAQITFTSLSNGFQTFLLGAVGAAGVNVNAGSWTIGGYSVSNAGIGFSPGPLSDGGSGNEDGFGSFNQLVDSFDGYTHSASLIQFTLTNTSGTWASASSVLAPNASGNPVAAHIFVADCATASACDAGVGALATGYATVVPEPSTLSLVLFGASLLAAVRRRSR